MIVFKSECFGLVIRVQVQFVGRDVFRVQHRPSIVVGPG